MSYCYYRVFGVIRNSRVTLRILQLKREALEVNRFIALLLHDFQESIVLGIAGGIFDHLNVRPFILQKR